MLHEPEATAKTLLLVEVGVIVAVTPVSAKVVEVDVTCKDMSALVTTCKTLPAPLNLLPTIAADAFISALVIVPSARFPDVMVFDAISELVMPEPFIVIAI
jgi:hypothetical protein